MIKAHDRAQNISLKLGANHGQRVLRVLHQFNGSQRVKPDSQPLAEKGEPGIDPLTVHAEVASPVN